MLERRNITSTQTGHRMFPERSFMHTTLVEEKHNLTRVTGEYNNKGYTEAEEEGLSNLSLIVSAEELSSQKEPDIGSKLLTEVDGTIIQLSGDSSIECEIYTPEQNKLIILPKGMFNFDVKIGQAFSLSLDDSTGFRRPLIKIREPNKEKMAEGVNELAALIDDL